MLHSFLSTNSARFIFALCFYFWLALPLGNARAIFPDAIEHDVETPLYAPFTASPSTCGIVNFDDSSHDDSGIAITFKWYINGVLVRTAASASGDHFDYTFPSTGSYTVAREIVSPASATVTHTQVVNLTGVDFGIDFGPVFDDDPQGCGHVEFHDHSFAACNNITLVRTWVFGDGTPTVTTNNASVAHNYMTHGTYTATLNVVAKNAAGTVLASASFTSIAVVVSHVVFSNILSDDLSNCGEFEFWDESTNDCGSISRTWNFGDGTAPVTTAQQITIHQYYFPGTYTVTEHVVATNDLTGASTSANFTTSITVAASLFQAEADFYPEELDCGYFNLDPNFDSYCSIGLQPINVSWDYGDGSTGSSLYHTYSLPGTKTVTLTTQWGYAGNPTPAVTTVTTQSLYVASGAMSLSINSPTSGPVCPGVSKTLSAVVGSASTNIAYSWSTGASTASVTEHPASTNTYSVTVTAGGCTKSASVNVLVNPAPVIMTETDNSCRPNDSQVYASAQATLNATGTGYSAYSWSNGGGNGPSATFAVTATTTYTVTVTGNATGCTTTASKTITLLDPMYAHCTKTIPTHCGANNGTATAVTEGGCGGPYAYQWSNGKTTKKIINLAPGNYTVTVTDAFGSSSTSMAQIADPKVSPIPVFTVTNITCNGQNNGIIAVGNPSNNAFLWNTAATTATINNLAANTYSVTVTDPDNACTAKYTKTITQPDPLTLTLVSKVPTAGGTFKVTLLAAGGTTPYTLQKCNAIGGGCANNVPANSRIFTGLTPATYTFKVIDSKGCEKTLVIPVPLTDPLEDRTNIYGENTDAQAYLIVLPNPATDLVNLQTDGIAENSPVRLFDANGKLLLTTTIDRSNNTSIDIAQLPPGVYSVVVIAGKKLLTGKIVKI